jgi:hypothetical protein
MKTWSMSQNAGAPRNGTLQHDDALPSANQRCQNAARVPLSERACFLTRVIAFFHVA